jgi:hypothetical protein
MSWKRRRDYRFGSWAVEVGCLRAVHSVADGTERRALETVNGRRAGWSVARSHRFCVLAATITRL